MMFHSSMHQQEDDFDQEPGEEEIHEYAMIIGIDPVKEPELMWIARAGITAPLPPDWKPVQPNEEELYFYNTKTGESSWEHPSDEKYRQMVLEERKNQSLKMQKNKKDSTASHSAATNSNSLKQVPTLPAARPPGVNALSKQHPPAKLEPVNLLPTTVPHSGPPKLGKLNPLIGTPAKEPPPPPHTLKSANPQKSINASMTSHSAAPSSDNSSATKSTSSFERPKTSRGVSGNDDVTASKGSGKLDTRDSPSPQQVVGGGSRFLKKNEPQSITTPSGKADILKVESPKGKIIGKLDYVESASESEDDDDEENETPSSVLSGPLDGELATDSHLILDIDELTPAQNNNSKSANNFPAPTKTTQKATPPSPPKPVVTDQVSKPVVHHVTTPTAKSQTLVSQKSLDSNPVQTGPASITPKTPTTQTIVAQQQQRSQQSPSPTGGAAVANPAKPNSSLVQQNQLLIEEAKLKTDHENKMKDLKQKFANDEDAEKKKLKKDMDDRVKKFQTDLLQEETKQKNELKSKHDKTLNDLKTKLQSEVDDFSKNQKSSTQASNDGENSVKEIRDKFASDKNRLNEEYEIELTEIRNHNDERLRSEMQRLEKENASKLSSLKSQFENDIVSEKEKFDREKQAKMLTLKRELDVIEKDIENEKARLNTEKAKLRENERKFMDEKTKEVQEKIELEVTKRKQELKRAHDREVSDLQTEFEMHLAKLRREHKEKINEEERRFKSNENVVQKQRHDETLVKETENRLTNLRQELNALSDVATNLKSSILDIQATVSAPKNEVITHQTSRDAAALDVSHTSNRSRKIRKTKTDVKKQEFVKSLDSFLSHEDDFSNGSTSAEQKLQMLESEDIVSKVQRFLASQEVANKKRQQNNDSRHLGDPNLFSTSIYPNNSFAHGNEVKPPSVVHRSQASVADVLNDLHKDFNALTVQIGQPNNLTATSHSRNSFRLYPRDAVDDFVDSKFREYFSDIRLNSSNRHHHDAYHKSSYYDNGERINVESELKSLKKWLEQFENDINRRRQFSVGTDNLDEDDLIIDNVET